VTIPSGEVAVLLGNGDGTFQSAVSYSSGTGSASSVTVSDLNGDGKLDLVVGGFPVALGVLLGNGDGTFQPAVTYSPGGGEGNIAIAVGDVNGDAKPDIIVSEASSNGGFLGPGLIAVLLGNGDGTFKPAVTYDSGGRGAGGVVVADVNGDGKPDVIAASQCPAYGTICGESMPGVISVLLGNGDGALQSPVTYVVGGFGAISAGAIGTADFNGDGLTDIVAAECTTFACDDGGNEVGIMLHVGTAPTTTTLTSAPNPSVFWQPVTFSALVTSKSGTPTGTVTFFNNSTILGATTLANGSASIPYFSLAPGTQSIKAVYGGSVQFDASTSKPLLQVVNLSTTTTSVASSHNPARPNEFVTYTATVTSEDGGGISGSVAFQDSGVVVATVGLAGNHASYRAKYLIGGSHTINATYSGDANNIGSTSPTLTEYIQTATYTTLASSLNPSVFGQKITWTAIVTSSGSRRPTGSVSFNWGIYSIGRAQLNVSGVAVLIRSGLNADTYPLTAVYEGDANNLASTSTVLNQVVTEATSSTALTSSPNPSTQGQAVTFTAMIKSPTVTVTGPVTFTVGKTVLGTIELVGGKAKFTISTLALGSTTVKVNYPGDSNISGSSASVKQTVTAISSD
jgi:hypothetical protein